MFPQEVIEEVRSANGVYDVISEYVPLKKKSGANYWGLCPFHSEKTPSFSVNPEREIFHCFGCGAGGNVFTFVMQYENMSFPEAVRLLAERRGITLPAQERRDSGREDSLRKALLAVNEKALAFFRQKLADPKEGAAAAAYLEARGMGREGVERFRLGWAPAGWDGLRDTLRRAGFAEELMLKAGLVIARQGGSGVYDRFRSRIVFPIANAQGEVVAFGGRVIDKEGEPKYMNSPETPLYQKSRILYGLDAAKGKIREAGYAVLVEGYLDLITAHLAGAANTVATLGTALTHEHLRLLKRFTGKAVMIYDGDEAGIEATKRSLEIFLEEDMTANSASLPDGHDPDSLIRARGVEAFREALKSSKPLMDFFIERTAARWRPEGIDGKAKAVEEMLPLLARMGNQIKRSEYIRSVSGALDIREEALEAELRAHEAGRKGARHFPPAPARSSLKPHRGEEELVRAMLLSREQAGRIREEVPLEQFSDQRCRAVAAAVYGLIGRDAGGDGPLNPSLEDPEAAALAAGLLAREGSPEELEKVARECLAKLRRQRLKKEMEEIQEKIRRAESARQTEVVDELLRIKQKMAKT